MNEDYAKAMIIDIYQQAAKKQTTAYTHRFIVFMLQYHAERTNDVTKKAGLTEQEIDKAYEYFDESTPNLFNSPNVRNITGLPPLREIQREERDYSENEDDDEEDEEDDYDTAFGERESSRQSAGTTRAAESQMKRRPMKGRRRTLAVRRPPPGSIVTNLYHAHITNFHAVAPPMTTMPMTDDSYSTTSTTTVLKLNYYLFGYHQDDDYESFVHNEY
eukprot:5191276-Amphidinium_carterae.1